MPFAKKFETLKQFHSRLQVLAHPTPLQATARDALTFLINNVNIFNRHVSHDTPFLREFFAIAENKDVSCESCFSLIECIVIFFREKALRIPHAAPAPEEEKLLRHFENSGEWEPVDGTLVSWWYWAELPLRHQRGNAPVSSGEA